MKILSRLKIESSGIKLYKIKDYFPTLWSSPGGDWHYPAWEYNFYNRVVKKTYLDGEDYNMKNASYCDKRGAGDLSTNTVFDVYHKFKKGSQKTYRYENDDPDNYEYNAAEITKYFIPKTKKAREDIDDKENTISFLLVHCWCRHRSYVYEPWERDFLVIRPEHVKYIETVLNR